MSDEYLMVVRERRERRSPLLLEMSKAGQFIRKATMGLMYAEMWDMLRDYQDCIAEGGDQKECMEVFYPDHIKSVLEEVDLPFPPPGPYVPTHETLKVLHSELSGFLAFIEDELSTWEK
jgi:hypothetical protein